MIKKFQMKNIQCADIFNLLVEIHNWEDENLPNAKSLTSRQVFLQLAVQFKKSPIKSIKLISSTKTSSLNSVRKALHELEKNNYIRKERLFDKRKKTILPNQNFEKLMHQYAEFVEIKVSELIAK